MIARGGDRAHDVEVVGRRHEDAGDDLLAVRRTARPVRRPSAESQLTMAPSPSSPASRSMRGRSAATRMGGRLLGHEAEPEALHLEGVVALGDLLAGERATEEAHGVARAPERVHERDAVPALDDRGRRRADAEREAPGRGVGHRRRRLREQRGTAGEGGHDRDAAAQRRRPRRRQRQRGEAVGTVGLAPTTRR